MKPEPFKKVMERKKEIETFAEREGYSGDEKEFIATFLAMDRPCPLRKMRQGFGYCKLDDERCYKTKLKFVLWGHWCEQKQKTDFELSDIAKDKSMCI